MPETAISCGIDTESCARFHKYLDQSNGIHPLLSDVFTKREVINNFMANPGVRFTLGFCCKEAVFKALGGGWRNSPVQWQEVELIFEGTEADDPSRVEIHGYAKDHFLELGGKNIIHKFEVHDGQATLMVIIV